jgi:serine/threonine protein kinase
VTQRCPTCKTELEDGVRYCPHDGTPLTETGPTSLSTPSNPQTVVKAPPLQLPVVVGNRYRLTEFRGGGGMARVYQGVDITLEREVAVKLINPELRAEPEFDTRFQREARIASQLHDPHIVVVHDFGIDADLGPFLVMEYLHGQSLRERLEQGPLPLKAGLQLGAQLLLALIHAHDKGIVHRDIKPDNIFLLNVSGVRMHVRVLDFGIARIYRSDEPGNQATLTSPGAVLGTPRYMSPEQLAGQPVDARSDLYSAAMVLHEALTGTLPYVSGKKLTELCPEASPALEALLDQCLKPNPAERVATSLEAYLRLQDLGKASGILLLPPGAMDKLLATRKTTAQEATIAYTPPPKPRRVPRRVLLGAPLLGMLVVLALMAFGVVHRFWPMSHGVLGIEVGDRRDDVVVRMGRAPDRELSGSPWATEDTRALLGHVLKFDDLVLPEAKERTKVLLWSSDEVIVVLLDDRVRTVIVNEPHKASSPRGIHLGDSVSRLEDRYREEQPELSSVPVLSKRPGQPSHVNVYRYDKLGIGFEVQGGHVSSITLYQAKP